jgi:hypothetical protein
LKATKLNGLERIARTITKDQPRAMRGIQGTCRSPRVASPLELIIREAVKTVILIEINFIGGKGGSLQRGPQLKIQYQQQQ